MTLNGAVVEPISIPVMYSSGYDLACLQDRYKLYGDRKSLHDLTMIVAQTTTASSSLSLGKEAITSGKSTTWLRSATRTPRQILTRELDGINTLVTMKSRRTILPSATILLGRQ